VNEYAFFRAEVPKVLKNADFFSELVKDCNPLENITNNEIGTVVHTSCEVALQADVRHVSRTPCKGLKRF
jgi:hypothetical protein